MTPDPTKADERQELAAGSGFREALLEERRTAYRGGRIRRCPKDQRQSEYDRVRKGVDDILHALSYGREECDQN